jgi:hypothetical protein
VEGSGQGGNAGDIREEMKGKKIKIYKFFELKSMSSNICFPSVVQ